MSENKLKLRTRTFNASCADTTLLRRTPPRRPIHVGWGGDVHRLTSMHLNAVIDSRFHLRR